MMKRKPLIFFVLMFVLVVLFSVTEVLGASPTFPTAENECMVIYGDMSKGKWFTIGLSYGPNGEWPTREMCELEDGTTREVSKYDYEVTGGKWSASEFYQTIPGLRPDDKHYDVDLDCSFSSINYIHPCEGTGSSKVPCFGDHLGERAIVKYTSAPSGDPPKFGHASSNSSGVGWSSLAFAIGNDSFYCMQYDGDGNPTNCGLPGPEIGEVSLIKNTEEIRWVGPKKVKLLINYKQCKFHAWDLDNPTVELEQHPITDLSIKKGDEVLEPINELWSHGKCNQGTLHSGEHSSATIWVGDHYVTIYW